MSIPQTDYLSSDLCIKMSDGRALTNYKQSCQITCEIMKGNKITDSYDLKSYLIHNGEAIRSNNTQFYLQKNACGSCQAPNASVIIPTWSNNN